MKELQNFEKLSAKSQIESEYKQKESIELKNIGSIRPQNGHALFEINTETLEVLPVTYKRRPKDIHWSEITGIYDNENQVSEVVVNPKCEYISALNKKSALDRYLKGKSSAVKLGQNKMTIL